jgi:hypothetical protein
MLGYLDVRLPETAWRDSHPNLAALFDRLMQRPSFRDTIPRTQVIDVIAHMRGRGDGSMSTDEIMALTRGK